MFSYLSNKKIVWVDGLFSDYPDRAREWVRGYQRV